MLAEAESLDAGGAGERPGSVPTQHRAGERVALPVTLLSPSARFAIGVLAGAAVFHGLLLLRLVVVGNDPPLTPPILFRLFLAWVAMPAAVAAAWWRLRRGWLHAEGGRLKLERWGRRLAVPLAEVESVRAWRLPWPAPGFALRLASGRRLPEGMVAADPRRLLDLLAAGEGETASGDDPGSRFCLARAAARRPRLGWAMLARFPGFALLPTLVLFRAHQYITFGGTFGQYYLRGLGPFLRTFAEYWGAVTLYLILYATLWRSVVEVLLWAGTWLNPNAAVGLRRWGERWMTAAYYGGVPFLLLVRFLP